MLMQFCNYIALIAFIFSVFVQGVECWSEPFRASEMKKVYKKFAYNLRSVVGQFVSNTFIWDASIAQKYWHNLRRMLELMLAVGIALVNLENGSGIIKTCWFVVLLWGRKSKISMATNARDSGALMSWSFFLCAETHFGQRNDIYERRAYRSFAMWDP